ncbi:unnamed protein product, partial [Larinioides sclopetarius]
FTFILLVNFFILSISQNLPCEADPSPPQNKDMKLGITWQIICSSIFILLLILWIYMRWSSPLHHVIRLPFV